jgi:hypothetical protein
MCALRVSATAAQTRLKTARTLTDELPRTLAALESGSISVRHAEVIADASWKLEPDVGTEFESLVLQRAAEQSLPELRRSIKRAALRVDPATAETRHQRARQDRCVRKTALAEGMAELRLFSPSATSPATSATSIMSCPGMRAATPAPATTHPAAADTTTAKPMAAGATASTPTAPSPSPLRPATPTPAGHPNGGTPNQATGPPGSRKSTQRNKNPKHQNALAKTASTPHTRNFYTRTTHRSDMSRGAVIAIRRLVAWQMSVCGPRRRPM